MASNINELSPEIRDFLLNRNLIPSDTVTDNGYSATGLGTQANITSSSNSVNPSIDIEDSSNDFRASVVSRNRYTSIEDMVSANIIDNSFSYNQIDGGYIDENRNLNLEGRSNDGLDVITSITSQEGFGLGSDGFFPQNSVNTSITGRVLGGVGAINDTKLGIIAGEQLLLALGQKASFNAQKELLGKVNLQPFSLLRSGDFLNPDYSITVSSSTGGRVLDTALDLTGFQLPISQIDSEGSIFEETPLNKTNSIERNNALIRNTGRGQILRLFESLNQNQYSPEYESDRNDKGVTDPNQYTKPTDPSLSQLSFNNTPLGSIPSSSQSVEFNGSSDIWSPDVTFSDDNSILSKTKNLFSKDNFRLYNSTFNEQGVENLNKKDQLTTPSGGRLSKGSGVLSEDFLLNNDKEFVFCRTWSSTKQYSTVNDLQKNSGLKDNPRRIRDGIEDSVLGDNGFVKISPYSNVPSDDTEDVKKYMFSIENLAWADNLSKIANFETGSGDPITGTKGRIMWFPPYDINFNESSSVNWDSTNFIGRGEPIYTYNNTERIGQLSFKVIIDHPDYLNDNNLSSDEIISSIMAGCSDYENFLSAEEYGEIQKVSNAEAPVSETVEASAVQEPDDIKFYFANDVASLKKYPNYEVGGEVQPNPTIPDSGYNSETTDSYENNTNFGLNYFWNNESNIQNIKDFLNNNEGFRIDLIGYSSLAGNSEDNQNLSSDRIDSIKTWIRENLGKNVKVLEGKPRGSSDSNATGEVDSESVKRDRKVTLEFQYDGSLDSKNTENAETEKEVRYDKEFVSKIKRRFHKESEYFEKLEKSEANSDKIIYDSIREKIKFFQPAFHSTTPEGFNSRLTFLQQCTRQGPTNDDNRANNLAFGAPPICILRIGDFYNTKIVIDNVSFDFEPLVWDLNPEGVGVQPMIAKVSLSFKFIGGSSLKGPINKLQNAVSFNYFGNTEVYDPRADRYVRGEDGLTLSSGIEDLKTVLSEDNNPITKEGNNSLANDQEAVAEKQASKQTVEPSATNPRNQIKNLNLVGYNYNSSTTELYLEFQYKNNPSNIIELNKILTGNITLVNSNNILDVVNVGSVTAKPDSQGSFIIENSDGSSQSTINSSTTSFSVGINLINVEDFITLFETLTSDGNKGVFKIRWPEINLPNTVNL
jgi:outer membrane protein OmpA-like peptidoglycan-associated protein